MKLIKMLSTRSKLVLLNSVVLGVNMLGDKFTMQDRVVRLADDLDTLYCGNVSYQECIVEATDTVFTQLFSE